MFLIGGHLYVYFTYGMHFCANVVTRDEGIGEAVLLRSVEPIAGISVMTRNRRLGGHDDPRNLTNGPAKFCQAFGIQRKDNGTDLLGTTITLVRPDNYETPRIASSRRIGINVAAKHRWRFFVKGNPWVSR